MCVALSGPISVLAPLSLYQHFRGCVRVCVWLEEEREVVRLRTFCHQGLDEIRQFLFMCTHLCVMKNSHSVCVCVCMCAHKPCMSTNECMLDIR